MALDTTRDPVVLAHRGPVTTITLDRPPLNVLDLATLRALNAALLACHTARVVILRSALPAFSAGVDVRDHAAEQVDAMLTEIRENARLLWTLPAVSVAAIRGEVLGGGAELACLCDMVIAADDARVATPEITLGAFPPVAAAWFPELCGWRRTIDLVLGASWDATTALSVGLVTRVVPAAQLDAAVDEMVDRLAGYSGVAVCSAMRALRQPRATAALERLDEIIDIYRSGVARSADAAEGIAAFLEKRAPHWSHR